MPQQLVKERFTEQPDQGKNFAPTFSESIHLTGKLIQNIDQTKPGDFQQG